MNIKVIPIFENYFLRIVFENTSNMVSLCLYF